MQYWEDGWSVHAVLGGWVECTCSIGRMGGVYMQYWEDGWSVRAVLGGWVECTHCIERMGGVPHIQCQYMHRSYQS